MGEAADAAAPARLLAPLGRAIAATPWFAAVGQPLDEAERGDVRLYLAGLGLADAAIEQVPDWAGAAAAAAAPGWNEAWWRAEEEMRRSLLARAGERFGHTAAMSALSSVAIHGSDHMEGAAAVAAARGGAGHPGLIKAAAGAATRALHLHSLAVIVGEDERHAFSAAFRLFAAGHWPLTLSANVYSVF